MKRIFSVTLAVFLLLLLGQTAFAATVTLRAATLEGGTGSSVDVPVEMAGASGLGALQWEVVFDPSILTYDSVTRGSQAGNALVEARSDTPGRLFIAVASVDDLKGDGPVAIARFKVTGATGASSNLTIENANAWEGASHRAVQVNVQPGKFTVGGLPWWLPYALIALAVILLLLIIILLLRRRRKPQPAPTYPQPLPNYYAPPAQYPPQPPVSPMPPGPPTGPYPQRPPGQPPQSGPLPPQGPFPQNGPYPPVPPGPQRPLPPQQQTGPYQQPQQPTGPYPQRPPGPPTGPYTQGPAGPPTGQPPQQQVIYCRNCGTPNPPNATVCRTCQRPMV